MSEERPEMTAWRLVEATVEESRRALGERFASAYAIGSLAHGGFATAASDVDVAILVEPGPGVAGPIAEAAARAQERIDGELATRLSVFHAPWPLSGPPDAQSRFPAIDRLDLLSHGVLVAGEDRRALEATAPSADEVRREAVEFSLDRLDSAEVATLNVAQAGLRKTTKLVLAPVRLLSLVETARVESNDASVEHYLQRSDRSNKELVAAALDWRRQGRFEEPDRAQRLVTGGLLNLHAGVLAELAERPEVPHVASLSALAERFRETSRVRD